VIFSNEQVVDKISVDLYNKKIFIHGEDGANVIFRCATVNELVELLDECKKLLKTDIIKYR
jgi:hypothetical protein